MCETPCVRAADNGHATWLRPEVGSARDCVSPLPLARERFD